jgi:transposase-like protein
VTAALHDLDGPTGINVPAPVELPLSDAEYGRAWLARHPVCPRCDGDLVETTRSVQHDVDRRYVCPDCRAKWRPDAAGTLRSL